MTNHVANIKIQRLLDPCSDHGNSSFYNMRPNDYGCKFFKVYQNLVTTSPFFLSFLPSHFLPCKSTFMDDYDRIYNYNSLKYGPPEFFDNF
jgi:hypothetical protein